MHPSIAVASIVAVLAAPSQAAASSRLNCGAAEALSIRLAGDVKTAAGTSPLIWEATDAGRAEPSRNDSPYVFNFHDANFEPAQVAVRRRCTGRGGCWWSASLEYLGAQSALGCESSLKELSCHGSDGKAITLRMNVEATLQGKAVALDWDRDGVGTTRPTDAPKPAFLFPLTDAEGAPASLAVFRTCSPRGGCRVSSTLDYRGAQRSFSCRQIDE